MTEQLVTFTACRSGAEASGRERELLISGSSRVARTGTDCKRRAWVHPRWSRPMRDLGRAYLVLTIRVNGPDHKPSSRCRSGPPPAFYWLETGPGGGAGRTADDALLGPEVTGRARPSDRDEGPGLRPPDRAGWAL